ncbi:hypothetical protein [Mucilaginibacter sp. UR6-11]|uniref:hypothetical protein n=1 Tax=Mucilaginibacter sp. UR6-11 TaxID=1435644 RepID=UPI001E499FE1|nr:hypothetical protein [Mucilaginibacter sp. UR6-11]MCC8425272.1 hypothetical protein [Mucilaginibacter sp. UR6-11]
MKRYFLACLILLAGLFFNSCKKEVRSSQICLHESSIDYLKRWAVEATETDVRDADGKLISHHITHPSGYFQINGDFTYNLFSDDAPVNGKWNINRDCEFVLNPTTAKERRFSVIRLSDDSLTLKQTVGHTTILQRYTAFKCPTLASLQFRWDNVFTLEAPYGPDTVFKAIYLKQPGYFKLNPDASYNLVMGPVNGMPPPPPLNGTWGIAQPGCLIVLDKRKVNERYFEVQKLTKDSLVIWRKDTIAKINYLQHYMKHK